MHPAVRLIGEKFGTRHDDVAPGKKKDVQLRTAERNE